MKQYEYVSMDYKGVINGKLSNLRKTIDEYAEKGYIYKGYIPTVVGSYGAIRSIDLIFEKEC